MTHGCEFVLIALLIVGAGASVLHLIRIVRDRQRWVRADSTRQVGPILFPRDHDSW